MGKLMCPIILGVVGVVLVALAAIVGFAVMPGVIDSQIEEQVRLVKDSDTWDKWKKNPVPVYFDVYVFNVTNPDEVNNGKAPNVTEFGRYRYEEFREKVNIVIDEPTDTISYSEKITFVFRREGSTGDDRVDRYNIVNTPFLIVSQAVYSLIKSSGLPMDLAHLIIGLLRLAEGDSLVRRGVSVREMIFDGVQLAPIYSLILSLQGEAQPEFEGNKFAFYRGKNGTPEDHFIVKSGISNSAEFGLIKRYNNESILNFWKMPQNMTDSDPYADERNRYCNMINGTDGSIFAPFQKKDNRLPIFVSDICRSIYLEFKEEIEHKDIPGYRFEFPKQFFEDPVDNGDNYCFCTSPEAGLTGECAAGVIRIFPCKSGAPIVTSSPHFLHAATEFQQRVNGLKPVEDLHATFIELEPNTGMMLRIDKKLQISMEVQPYDTPFFRDLPHYLFPAFWVNEHTQLSDELAKDLISDLFTPMLIIDVAKWTILGIGIVLAVAGIGLGIARR